MAICSNCGRETNCYCTQVNGKTCYFCFDSNHGCEGAFRAKYETKGNETSSSSASSSSVSSADVGAAIGVAAAGIGAVGAGAGAALKGAGAALKGAGSLLGTTAKGLGALGKAVGSQVGGEFSSTHKAEDQIREIQNLQMSADPEEYKNQIFALYDKATSKPADPIRDPFVIKAAKNKVIHELDMLKVKNPAMFNEYQALYEQLHQKKKLFGIFG